MLYDTPVGGETLVVRPRDVMDNATPSGTSLAVELWLRLAPFTGDPRGDGERVRRVLAREAGGMARFATAFGRLLSGVGHLLSMPVEVAILGPREEPAVQGMLAAAHRRYLPVRAITGAAPGDAPLPFPTPLLEGREMRGGRAAAYVCRDGVCGEPIGDAAGVEAALR